MTRMTETQAVSTLSAFEPIARGDPKVGDGRRGVQVGQLALDGPPYRLRNRSRPLRIFTIEDVFCGRVTERLNHPDQYTRLPGIRGRTGYDTRAKVKDHCRRG